MSANTSRGLCVEALLLALLSGCHGAPDGWQQQGMSELVAQGNAVLDAVDALPECAGLRSKGGIIHWQTQVFCGGSPVPVLGCTYPRARPPVVQLVFESAWSAANRETSTLAHELCHACGYTDPDETEACQRRARLNYVPPKNPELVAPTGPPEATAALVEAAGARAADAVRRGDLAEARQALEGALRGIDPATPGLVGDAPQRLAP